MNKPRLGDIKKLSWSHKTSEGQCWGTNPSLFWFHSPGPCWFHPRPFASLILFLINSEKTHPQNAESSSLCYRPSTAGVTSKDTGMGVVETTVARGSRLLGSWVTRGASAVAEGSSLPPSAPSSPLVTSRGETCWSSVTRDTAASAAWTAVVFSWVMMS